MEGSNSPSLKPKRHRNRHRFRPALDDGDGNAAASMSRSSPTTSPVKHKHSQQFASGAKRLKYSDKELKLETSDRGDGSSPRTNAIPARVEIDVTNHEAYSGRKKSHYPEMRFIKVEVDDEHVSSVVFILLIFMLRF